MTYKQKLGYMLLGAGILALGIIIGQWGTPDIEAQSNGVFDKITCREIEVVDKDGNKAIVLHHNEFGHNELIVYHPQGRQGIKLQSGGWGNYAIVFEDADNEQEAVALAGTSTENYVIVRNFRSSDRAAAKLISKEDISSVEVLDKNGNPAAWLARLFPSHPHYQGEPSRILLRDKEGANRIGLIHKTGTITTLGD